MSDWENQLDVVNCAKSFEDIAGHSVYICPTQGNNYMHRRSKYFGLYRNKHVELIAQIDAVVDVDEDRADVLWKNVDASAESLIAAARRKIEELQPGEFRKRIFLLSECHLTDFEKDTPGGMFPSRQYFDITGLNVTSAKDLAAKLNGRRWSEV